MTKEVCLWNKVQNKAADFSGREWDATYQQMISDGWLQKLDGVDVVVFEKESA